MNRLLVIGLDGATFDLIKPWVQQGELPNIAKILQQDVHGELKSTVPPMSPPAWTSFMTGKNPGKHGIIDFTARKPYSYEIEFINARWRQAETIWKIMSDAGKRVCVIAVPITYPPEKINGVMISGIDTPGATGGVADRSAMHPADLHAEIFDAVGPYLISPNLVAYADDQCDAMLEAALQTMARKVDTALYLYRKEPWDCFMLVLGETDGIAHRLWKYHDPQSPLAGKHGLQRGRGNPLLRLYQQVDHHLGRLLSLAPDDTTIFIFSDHGQGGNGAKAVYLNRWLEEHELLEFIKDTDGVLGLSLVKHMILMNLEWAKKIGLKFLPPNLKRKLLRGTGLAKSVESWLRFSHIDWSQTKAYSEETPYFPNIWINVQGREPGGIVSPGKEYEAVREHLIELLSQWKDPDTGHPVVKKVHKREKLYDGPYVERFPDLMIEWHLDNGYSYLFKNSQSAKGSVRPISRLDGKEKQRSKSGDHRDYGIFLASGADVIPQMTLSDAAIIDLAPTMLYLLGLPIPSDMDGKVLTRMLNDAYLRSHPLQYCHRVDADGRPPKLPHDYSSEEEEAIRARLQGLGYIE
jgi:predicted AlkP superfamily phosphohydrolase/phosphomutase